MTLPVSIPSFSHIEAAHLAVQAAAHNPPGTQPAADVAYARRLDRAVALALAGAVLDCPPAGLDEWTTVRVASQTTAQTYNVRVCARSTGLETRCNCPDARRTACKHELAVLIRRGMFVLSARQERRAATA